MIFTFDILYHAWKNTVTQNSEQRNKSCFKYYLTPNLLKLLKELETGTFTPSKLRNQKVYVPKPRVVQVPAIRDKIVQHAICDNYLNYALTKPLIKETSACLPGRGTNYASNIVRQQLRNYFLKTGKEFFVLKCDISNYFASIQHEHLFKISNRYVDDAQIANIMRSFIEQLPIGLALGLQQSQLLANLYLSGLDHYCKEQLHCKYYGRYMDDFYIISNSYEYLNDCWQKIGAFLQDIGLLLNPKTCIMANKLEFIGFDYYLTSTGKVLKYLSNKKKKSKKRHIKKMLSELENGTLGISDFCNKYACWRSHALQGNCYKLVTDWDRKIKSKLYTLGYILSFHEMRWNLCQKQSQN